MPIGRITCAPVVDARRVAAVMAAVAVLVGGGARAEWQVDGVLSETLEAVTDRERDGVNDPAYGSTTFLGVTISALDPRTQWTTDLGLTAAKFVGPGAENDFNRIDPSFSTALQRRLTDWTFGLNGSFDVQPTSVTQLDETGLTDEDAIQFSANVSASVNHDIGPRDGVGVRVSFRGVEFSEENDNLTPSVRFGLDLNWDRLIDRRTSTSLRLGLSQLRADDEDDTTTNSGEVTAGFTHTLHNRLSFNALLGPNISFTNRSNGGADDVGLGATGSAGIAWQPTNESSLGFDASQNLEANSDGELQNVARLGFSASHAFNAKTSGSFQVSYSRRSDSGDVLPLDPDLEVLSLTPTLNVSIYRDIRATVGYALSASREDGQEAASNRFFVTLSTEF